MNRLKAVKEEMVAKQKRLDEIEALCKEEKRSWNKKELKEVDQIEKDIDALAEEKTLLEKHPRS